MKHLEALRGESTEHLRDMRAVMWEVYSNLSTPEGVKQASAVLINFYGAEIDARMMERDK